MDCYRVILVFCGLIVTSHGLIGDDVSQTINSLMNSGAGAILGNDDNDNSLPITNALLAGGTIINSALTGGSKPLLEAGDIASSALSEAGSLLVDEAEEDGLKDVREAALNGATKFLGGAGGIAGAASQGLNAIKNLKTSVLSGTTKLLGGSGSISGQVGQGLKAIRGVKNTVMSGAKALLAMSGGGDSSDSDPMSLLAGASPDLVGLGLLAMNSMAQDSSSSDDDESYDKTGISEVVGSGVKVDPVPSNRNVLKDVLDTVDDVVDAKLDGLSAVATGGDIIERGINSLPGTIADIGGLANTLIKERPPIGSPVGPPPGQDPKVDATIKDVMNGIRISTSEFKAIEPVVDIIETPDTDDILETVQDGLGNVLGIELSDDSGRSDPLDNVVDKASDGMDNIIEAIAPDDDNGISLVANVVEGKTKLLRGAMNTVVETVKDGIENVLEAIDDGNDKDDREDGGGMLNFVEEILDRDFFERIGSDDRRDTADSINEYWDNFRSGVRGGITSKLDTGFLFGKKLTKAGKALFNIGQDSPSDVLFNYYPNRYRVPLTAASKSDILGRLRRGKFDDRKASDEIQSTAKITIGYNYQRPVVQPDRVIPSPRFRPQAWFPRRETRRIRGRHSLGSPRHGIRPTFRRARFPLSPLLVPRGRRTSAPRRPFVPPPRMTGPSRPLPRVPLIPTPLLRPRPFPMAPGGFGPHIGPPGIPPGPPFLPPPSAFIPIR